MKAIPIGNTDFKKLIEDDCYYVDKSKVIEDLLIAKTEVTLYTRPRRFGKTLLMTMLYNFFEIDLKETNKDLFKDLYISKSTYYNELSNYPTIYMNFKDLKQESYQSAYNQYKILISSMYRSKSYIIDKLDEKEIEKFNRIKDEEGTLDDYKNSVKLLSEWLERYYNKKVIILIDEYDASINESFVLGYYKDLMNLISPILSSALKDNKSLKFGVLTGVLRVGGESLFSSFNNPKICDVMSERYNEYFGFTLEETKEVLEYYGLYLTSDVKSYYDGYLIGGESICNPWSILNYCFDKKLKPYWVNTGSNKLMKKLLTEVSNKNAIEKLIQGESIYFDYDKSITYESFEDVDNLNNLLNLLLVSGYVTFDRKEEDGFGGEQIYYKIPNKEVREDLIRILDNISYKQRILGVENYRDFISSFLSEDKEYIEEFLNERLLSVSNLKK